MYVCVVVDAKNASVPEDMFLSTTELIAHWGYPVETHEVRTDDGYLLTMHRIPHGRHSSKRSVLIILEMLLFRGFGFMRRKIKGS